MGEKEQGGGVDLRKKRGEGRRSDLNSNGWNVHLSVKVAGLNWDWPKSILWETSS